MRLFFGSFVSCCFMRLFFGLVYFMLFHAVEFAIHFLLISRFALKPIPSTQL